MDRAIWNTSTNTFHGACLASQVLFLQIIGHIHILFTICHSSKERHLARVALIEGRFCHYILLWPLEPLAFLISGRFHINLFLLYHCVGESFDLSHRFHHFFHLELKLGVLFEISYWMLACWASHEVECDAKRVPSMFDQVTNAVCMENVTALKLYARIWWKLACVTDIAKIILRWQVAILLLNAFRFETWQAASLVC